ncbi:MAG: response regulator [Ketobacter sp.]|nr:response regulator [Ketobacter sp.]
MSGRNTGAIRKQLVGWFLTVGLLPLILVAVISYQQARSSLQEAAHAELSQTAAEKIRFINAWFDYRWMDLDLQANNPTNIALINTLETSFRSSGKSLAEFIKSDEWQQLAQSRRLDLINLLAAYDYMYDLFLIDTDGNILFTVVMETDLGTNLINGPHKDTRFAHAFVQALDTNEPIFSDYERYAPSANMLSGFLVTPLLDQEGHTKGAFALQVRLERINQLLLHQREHDINHYLVGEDGLLRSQFGNRESEVLNTAIHTDIFSAWQNAHGESHNQALQSSPVMSRYLNPKGEEVIGQYNTVNIGNVTWALISEIKRDTAFASITWLAQLDVILLLLSTVAITLCATYLAGHISLPLAKLNDAVEAFTHNNHVNPVAIKSRNEIGNLADNFNLMIKARERYERRIKDSETATRNALTELSMQQRAVSHHAIVAITDIRGTILYVNSKFEEVSGYSAAELIGSNHRILNSGFHPQSFFREMYLTISKGNIWNAEICNRAKNGHLYWVATTIAPLRDDTGNIDRYMAIRTDITDQKAVQHELRQAKDVAESAARIKSEFLATMSHEIRTPMNGVLGMLGLLMRTKLDADQQHQARLAMSSAESLLVIINDILDFSKIEAGRLEIDIIDFDLGAMLGEFAESMAPRAHEKGLELILDVVGIEHSMVKGDPGRLRQIIANLVSNSIKFTEHGEIVIQASLHTTPDYQYQFECIVSDTGIGIPQDRIEHIFGSFTQVDASTTRRFGGTGLGLAIVTQLCQLMNGTIQVNSTEHQGSQFHFKVMLQPSQLSQALVPSINVQNVPMLVVDDNATNREVLKRQLQLWGAQVQLANDGEQALELMEARQAEQDESGYAVVFIDMLMPNMTGTELGQRIRSNPKFNPTKLIMMTSIGNRGDAHRLAQLGFNGYFPKPTTLSDLLHALAVLLEDGEALAQATPLVTQHYLKSLRPDQCQDTIWPQHCRLLLAEDNPINQNVVQGMLEEFDLHCEMANNGKEAIELLQNAESRFPYTLILMDCQMPILDGYDASQQIRSGVAGKRYQQIPIVAMTANAMAGDREKCLDAGMNDYMSKPINIDELYKKLTIWLNGDAPGALSATSTPQPTSSNALWDKAEALKRVRNKPERLNTLIDMFLNNSQDLVAQIRTGLANNDYAAASQGAHTLKSVAGNLSAQRLMKAAGQLEEALREGETDNATELTERVIRQHAKVSVVFQAHVQGDDHSPNQGHASP